MKKILLIGLTVVAMVGLMVNCEKDDDHLKQELRIVKVTETNTNCNDIWAGQNILAGQVCLADIDTNDDGIKDAIELTFTTQDGWEITKVHFHIANSMHLIPQNRGGIIPGQMQFNSGELDFVEEYVLVIPFTDFGYDCDMGSVLYYAAAHLEVAKQDPSGYWQTETGWAHGAHTPGRNWSMIFSFTIECDEEIVEPPQEPNKLGSAYAVMTSGGGVNDTISKCFVGGQWGWVNQIWPENTYEFDIYAGAGQCDLSKGTHVGTLTVNYIAGAGEVLNGEAEFTFVLFEGFTASKIDIYISDSYPDKYAPGLYGNTEEFDGLLSSHTLTLFPGAEGLTYMIAHLDIYE